MPQDETSGVADATPEQPGRVIGKDINDLSGDDARAGGCSDERAAKEGPALPAQHEMSQPPPTQQELKVRLPCWCGSARLDD